MAPITKPNRYALRSDGSVLMLLDSNVGTQLCFIDAADLELVTGRRWHAKKFKGSTNTFYAVRTLRESGKCRTELMHRILLGLTDPEILVDHGDGNGLNNRQSNLTRTDRVDNPINRKSCNSSNKLGIRNVSKGKRGGYGVTICYRGVRYYCGSYLTATAAKRVAERARKELAEGKVPYAYLARHCQTDARVRGYL